MAEQSHKPPAKAAPKPLKIGPARDRFEAEAETIANRLATNAGLGATMAPTPPPAISPVPAAAMASRMPNTRRPTPPEIPEEEQSKPKPLAQREAYDTTGSGEAPAHVAASVAAMKGSGKPLPGALQAEMEDGIGRDLSAVRLHDNARAADAASAINARAFTVGNDVFFGQSQYHPDSSSGRKLIAHELVHTVQQSGGSTQARRSVIQRSTASSKTASTDEATIVRGKFKKDKVEIDLTGAKPLLQVAKLELPPAPEAMKGTTDKKKAISPAGTKNVTGLPDPGKGSVTLEGRTPRVGTAETKWIAFQKQNMTDLTPSKVLREHKSSNDGDSNDPYISEKNGKDFYFFMPRGENNAQQVIMGTDDELKTSQAILRPNWDKSGKAAEFQVDHILELQIGGKDSGENLWLLDRSFNASAGSSINQWIRSSIGAALKEADTDGFTARARAAGYDMPGPERTEITRVKHNWTIRFASVVMKSTENTKLDKKKYWTKSELKDGEHLTSERVRLLSLKELMKFGFSFNEDGTTPKCFNVFGSPTGGVFVTFKLSNDKVTEPTDFFKGLEFKSATYDKNDGMKLTIMRKRRKRVKNDPFKSDAELTRTLPVTNMPHLGNAGYITTKELTKLFGVSFRYLSPMEFSHVGIGADGAVKADGVIKADKSLMGKVDVPIFIDGTEISMGFDLPKDKISFGPLDISEPSLSLGYGESGFFIEGGATVKLDQIGSGQISATGTDEDVVVGGDFALDMDFLEPAKITCTYSLSKESISGELNAGVKKGFLPGVAGGKVQVNFTNEKVSVSGTIALASPLDGTNLNVDYDDENGLTIGAENIDIPAKKLPGLSSATLSLSAKRLDETGQWSISGTGTAAIGTPGVTGAISLTYNDGAILITGNGNVEIGTAKGDISVSVTNMPLDEDGNPAEGEISDTLRIFGAGSVTIAFGKVLTGTAGVEFTPQGTVTIAGEIALPPSLEVFEKKDFSRELIAMETPDIPIWGVSIAGVGVGIFASIDGYVNLDAWIGPGTIQDAKVSATMDLAHPEDMTVTGSAKFVMPAYGGLALGIGGSIYARAAVAYARGRVGFTGKLGVAASAATEINVDWNKDTGLVLEAEAKAEAKPKFNIGVEASISAGVDLGWAGKYDKNLGKWAKSLGEFGPEMTLGVTMPAKWSEANGLEMSLDDIEVQKPSFKARDFVMSAFKDVVN